MADPLSDEESKAANRKRASTRQLTDRDDPDAVEEEDNVWITFLSLLIDANSNSPNQGTFKRADTSVMQQRR